LLVAAGRVSHRHLVRLVRGYERRFADGRRPAFLPAPPPKGRPRCGLVTKDTEQTQLALGIHTCARRDDRRYPLRLLNTILGESMSSRLFQTIREDLGLAYSVHSGLSYFDDAGNLTISAGLDTEKLPRVLRLIVAELRRLRRRAPSSGELQRAKDYVLGQIDLSLENTESQMMSLGEQWLGHGRLHSPARVKRRLASVSAGEVLAVARDFFRPERLDLALVSPIKSTRHLLPLLDFST
jgi:predicted Zn-dependent peptidase